MTLPVRTHRSLSMPLPPRLTLTIIVCLGVLAGCKSPPPQPTFPDLHFGGSALRLNVAALEIRDDYQPPYRPPNVEHLFPVPPLHALENWARDRLQAGGASGQARFTITDAGVVETELPRQEGLRAELTTQVSERYDMTLAARLEILDAAGQVRQTASARVTRRQDVLEGTTINQRDQIWYDMTKALLADFDTQMTAAVRSNLAQSMQ